MRVNTAGWKRIAAILAVGLLALATAGCSSYTANRLYDFCDIWQGGVGISTENPETGCWPPSLGAHVQLTDFLNLGAIHFSGHKAEMDGRGFYAGRESRTRLGFLPIQVLQIDQEYTIGAESYFKKKDCLWTRRMNTREMRWLNAPAKEVEYEYWADQLHKGTPVFHRGWQYWENCSMEIGICEPFLTHLGFYLILGMDPSEVSDFLLGWTTYDFKKDDLRPDEWVEYSQRGPRNGYATDPRPPAAQ